MSLILSISVSTFARQDRIIFQLKLTYLVLNTILTYAPHDEKVLEAFKAFPFGELLKLLKRMHVECLTKSMSFKTHQSFRTFEQENKGKIEKLDLLFCDLYGWNKSDLATLEIQLSVLYSAICDAGVFNTPNGWAAGPAMDPFEFEEMVMFLDKIEGILANRVATLCSESSLNSSSSSSSSSSSGSSSSQGEISRESTEQ